MSCHIATCVCSRSSAPHSAELWLTRHRTRRWGSLVLSSGAASRVRTRRRTTGWRGRRIADDVLEVCALRSVLYERREQPGRRSRTRRRDSYRAPHESRARPYGRDGSKTRTTDLARAERRLSKRPSPRHSTLASRPSLAAASASGRTLRGSRQAHKIAAIAAGERWVQRPSSRPGLDLLEPEAYSHLH